jgi:hypothetical protein
LIWLTGCAVESAAVEHESAAANAVANKAVRICRLEVEGFIASSLDGLSEPPVSAEEPRMRSLARSKIRISGGLAAEA